MPAGTAQARIDAIESEGATVEVVDGSYDDAVRLSAGLAGERRLVLSDTSWPGYEEVPRWVIEGYATIFHEVDEQAAAPPSTWRSCRSALAHSPRRPRATSPAVRGSRASSRWRPPACWSPRAPAGSPRCPGPHASIMAGLNAGLPSLVAWPLVSGAFERALRGGGRRGGGGHAPAGALGLEVGECSGGAAGAAARLLADPDAREALGADEGSTVLVLLTEGVTDPDAYVRIVA